MIAKSGVLYILHNFRCVNILIVTPQNGVQRPGTDQATFNLTLCKEKIETHRLNNNNINLVELRSFEAANMHNLYD